MSNGSENKKAALVNRGSTFALSRNRLQLLHRINQVSETPMALLGLAWFCLMVVDLTRGLRSTGQNITTIIWVVFIADFILRLTLAPRKVVYIRKNWLTVIALILPALRVMRCVRDAAQPVTTARATPGAYPGLDQLWHARPW